MQTPDISAVIMIGSGGDSPQEQLMLQAQRASTLDLIATLRAQNITPIILAAPTTNWVADGSDIVFDQDKPDQPFHFGRRLSGLITHHNLHTTMYFGGGSAPLLDESLTNLIALLIDRASAHVPGSQIPSHIVLTNNIHSSDWIALTHALEAAPIIENEEKDNSLAWVLRQSGEYDVRSVTSIRPAAALDLDTPSDLALVAHHPDIQPNLAAVVQDERLAAVPVQEIAAIAATPETNLTLIGRVPPTAWQALNKVTQCWVRVFAEERGMVASGRLARREVQSLLGEMIRQEGPGTFFKTLASMTDAAIIDSRPLMASQGRWPDAADRFASDLYMVNQIKDPWLREFTAAAANAPLPVLLGGHSVVAGGLHVLTEIIERQTT